MDPPVITCGIASIVIILMSTFAGLPFVATVLAGDRIGMGSAPVANFNIDPLARLQAVSVSWWMWRWPKSRSTQSSLLLGLQDE